MGKDYLDEDYIHKNQKYTVISYYENKQDTKKEILGLFKIKGVYKDLDKAQLAVKSFSDEDKKFNIFIIETGKWNGFYSEKGLEKADGNRIQSNEMLNNIMKERKASLEEAELEHSKRVQACKHINSVKSTYQKALNFLEKNNYIKINKMKDSDLKELNQKYTDTRRKLRKDDNNNKMIEFRESVVNSQIKRIDILLNDLDDFKKEVSTSELKEAETGENIELYEKLQVSKDLNTIYKNVVDDNKKSFENLEDIIKRLLTDIEIYTNYIENFEDSLVLSKEDIKAQIKELETKLDDVVETQKEFQHYTKDMYEKHPLELEF